MVLSRFKRAILKAVRSRVSMDAPLQRHDDPDPGPLDQGMEEARMLSLRLIDHVEDSVVLSFMEADGSWWVPRTSNPVCGATSVAGGFDSHALPPIYGFIAI
jgi:hypothetical protein